MVGKHGSGRDIMRGVVGRRGRHGTALRVHAAINKTKGKGAPAFPAVLVSIT